MIDLEAQRKALEELRKRKETLEKEVVKHEALLNSLLQRLRSEHNIESLVGGKEKIDALEKEIERIQKSLSGQLREATTKLSEIETLLKK
jgi:hypothetical protein